MILTLIRIGFSTRAIWPTEGFEGHVDSSKSKLYFANIDFILLYWYFARASEGARVVLWLPIGPAAAAAANCGTSCDVGATVLIPLEASVRLDEDHASITYLGAIVFGGASAVTTPVGLATEV